MLDIIEIIEIYIFVAEITWEIPLFSVFTLICPGQDFVSFIDFISYM